MACLAARVRRNVPAMKCAPLIACLLAAVVTAHAQQQEEGLLQRIEAARPDSKKISAMQNKSFGSSNFALKSFGTPSFGGLKGAQIKSFETRSFLGVKNPWFGKKIYDTFASNATGRSAADASKQFQSEAFAVREYDKSSKKDLADAGAALPSGAQPRPYLIAPKAEGGVSRFTQNLQKELTIDDVRDLLNKGKGE
jgi:hypothetical protein